MAKRRVGAPKKALKDKVSVLAITVKNSKIDRVGGKKEGRKLLSEVADKW